MTKMTLEQFRSTRKECDHIEDDSTGETASGFTYEVEEYGTVWIQNADGGGFWTLMDNQDFFSWDLDSVEEWLHARC